MPRCDWRWSRTYMRYIVAILCLYVKRRMHVLYATPIRASKPCLRKSPKRFRRNQRRRTVKVRRPTATIVAPHTCTILGSSQNDWYDGNRSVVAEGPFDETDFSVACRSTGFAFSSCRISSSTLVTQSLLIVSIDFWPGPTHRSGRPSHRDCPCCLQGSGICKLPESA